MGPVEDVTGAASATFKRAGAWAMLAAALVAALLWRDYTRDQREAQHMTKLEAAIDRFAGAAESTTRAMDALRGEVASQRDDAIRGRTAAVQTLAEQIKACCSRRQ